MTSAAKVLPISDAEAKRLAALRKYDILDSPPDGAFDRITAVAASIFSAPISIISLVDHDRIWFKSHHGLDVEEIGRDPGLCASAIMQNSAWIVSNAKADPRTLANPLVAGEFGLKFYVGAPLRTHDGFNLGTLCVIDRTPREASETQIAQLTDLASVVMDQMELRLSARSTVAKLQKTVVEKEMMAKEVDHRVKNSLQLVSSLLAVQSRNVGGEASEQLSKAASRVSAVGRAHEHLYLSDSIGTVDCLNYLRRVCADLSALLDGGGIVVEGSEVQMPTKYVVPLGLIVTELVTNAAKQGARNVTVSLAVDPSGRNALSVTDDGKGLPADFDPAVTRGLGMKVISSLVSRLKGEMTFGAPGGGGRGARFTVLFGA
ncbi:MAG: GAF domain-containing protein [Rhizobiales bacterium]|nr:GAF domain-containing protein [Hyphomicrobiales bacterium]